MQAPASSKGLPEVSEEELMTMAPEDFFDQLLSDTPGALLAQPTPLTSERARPAAVPRSDDLQAAQGRSATHPLRHGSGQLGEPAAVARVGSREEEFAASGSATRFHGSVSGELQLEAQRLARDAGMYGAWSGDGAHPSAVPRREVRMAIPVAQPIKVAADNDPSSRSPASTAQQAHEEQGTPAELLSSYNEVRAALKHTLHVGGASSGSLGGGSQFMSDGSPVPSGSGARQQSTESGRAAAAAAMAAATAAAREQLLPRRPSRNSPSIPAAAAVSHSAQKPRSSAAQYEKMRRDQMKERFEALRAMLGEEALQKDKISLLDMAREHITSLEAQLGSMTARMSTASDEQARLSHQINELTDQLRQAQLSGITGTGEVDTPDATGSKARKARTMAEVDKLVDDALHGDANGRGVARDVATNSAAAADSVASLNASGGGLSGAHARVFKRSGKSIDEDAAKAAARAGVFKRSDSYLCYREGAAVIEIEEVSDEELFFKVQAIDRLGGLLHELTKVRRRFSRSMRLASLFCRRPARSTRCCASDSRCALWRALTDAQIRS